jgi:hypothetical protein
LYLIFTNHWGKNKGLSDATDETKLRLTFIRGVARLLPMKFPSEEVNKSQKQPPLFSSLSTVEVQI